jgi:hypothetical protein
VTEALDSFSVLALDRCCEGDCGSEECVAVLIPMEIVAARHRSLFILQKSCNSGFQYDMKELRFVEGGRGSSECERAGNDTRNMRLNLRSFLAASSLLIEACLFHWAWVKFVAFFCFVTIFFCCGPCHGFPCLGLRCLHPVSHFGPGPFSAKPFLDSLKKLSFGLEV